MIAAYQKRNRVNKLSECPRDMILGSLLALGLEGQMKLLMGPEAPAISQKSVEKNPAVFL